MLVPVALKGSLHVRFQNTWVHGAQAVDGQRIEDARDDLTLSMNGQPFYVLWIVHA